MRRFWTCRLVSVFFFFFPAFAPAGIVAFKNNKLFIDDKAQPQLWGAEIQYFRLRGGSERNIPRAQVLEIWNRVLDRVVEAKMNTVSFYIPWDFHEYAEGRFDFDGTADEDGDGRADYPSRDVKTFIQMILDRGLRNIMVRPGPYINAEWGFLGFGAVPLWFHEKFPGTHCVNPEGLRSPVYQYLDPIYLSHAKLWLRRVYQDVLKPHIGAGKPISFLQLDNETNFMWQSLYNHDYGPRSLRRYREFLRERYQTLERVNLAHSRNWMAWEQILPPKARHLNLLEDQDWYRFQDITIRDYLREIRKTWESLGVREPQVLFTLAESYNAPGDGLLPHYEYRNEPGLTGMMTVNLYPKTWGSAFEPLLNSPFKADLDVKSADAASDHYLGRKEEWVLGPEIQGGWWRGTEVSHEARLQTYLSTLGHGLKALFIYYFHEGDNWQSDWAKKQIRPDYEALKSTEAYRDLSADSLPVEFWNELRTQVQKKHFFTWDPMWILRGDGLQPGTLYFDAPLGPEAGIRPPYKLIREIGEKIIEPYGEFLAGSIETTDPVCFVKDSAAHAPSPVAGLDSLLVQSEWAGGLLGYLLQAGINPKVIHWGLTQQEELKSCRLIVYQDTGMTTPNLGRAFHDYMEQGGSILSFLHDGIGPNLFGPGARERLCQPLTGLSLPLTGYECAWTETPKVSGRYYFIHEPLYSVINSTGYGRIQDLPLRLSLLAKVMRELSLEPRVRLSEMGDRVAVFARNNPENSQLWVTVKSGRAEPFTGRVLWREARADRLYEVSEVLSGSRSRVFGEMIKKTGFEIQLPSQGSSVYFIEPVGK